MRRSRCYEREEGLILRRRPPDEFGGLTGEHVGVEVFGFAAVGDHFTVLVDAVVVELLSVQLAVPFTPARRYVGGVILAVTVEVFAKVGGPVALLLQAGGDRTLLESLVAKLLESTIRGLVALYAVVVVFSKEIPCSTSREFRLGICWAEA